jgi:acid phosphatase
MEPPPLPAAIAGANWISRLVGLLGILLILQVVVQQIIAMRSHPKFGALVAATAFGHFRMASAAVDLSWYPPNATVINNLTHVLGSTGIYGFIYNNSYPTDTPYGTYDWCNMPHVRKQEYKKPSDEYKLKYVELVSSHCLN